MNYFTHRRGAYETRLSSFCLLVRETLSSSRVPSESDHSPRSLISGEMIIQIRQVAWSKLSELVKNQNPFVRVSRNARPLNFPFIRNAREGTSGRHGACPGRLEKKRTSFFSRFSLIRSIFAGRRPSFPSSRRTFYASRESISIAGDCAASAAMRCTACMCVGAAGAAANQSCL